MESVDLLAFQASIVGPTQSVNCPLEEHRVKSAQTLISVVVLVVLLVPVGAHAQSETGLWKRLDQNRDGQLTKEELPEPMQRRFNQMDTDQNGLVTQAEFNAFRNRRNAASDRSERAETPAPAHADVAYGDHQRQSFDLWLAESKDGRPTPLVIFIHGGGFRGGDKKMVGSEPIEDYLRQGISFASMNYRMSEEGPYPIMMLDAARGLQTIRSRAQEWNLDPHASPATAARPVPASRSGWRFTKTLPIPTVTTRHHASRRGSSPQAVKPASRPTTCGRFASGSSFLTCRRTRHWSTFMPLKTTTTGTRSASRI